jgi:sugar/nucleoside kinase (ribokinase family)
MINNEAAFDVIAIGDTTQDVFLKMSDASVQCSLDGENCKICFDFADKIAVDEKSDVPGVGNAANHAVGTARLGLRSALYTMVGDDVQGRLASDVLKENNVDVRYVFFDKSHGTNFSAVINFQSERTILVYHEPRDYKLPDLAASRWVYVTSASGGGVVALHEQVLSYLEKNPEVNLAFNPGTHQIHLGLEKLLPLLARTSVLFLNREESAEVLGVQTDDVTVLIRRFHDLGVKTMVVTDGPDGSYASDGSKIWYLKIFAGPVIERTGAGDSFGSGFLAALVKGKTIQEAMLWGNANSTSVVQFVGAREGLLYEAGVQKVISQNPAIRPEKFATL